MNGMEIIFTGVGGEGIVTTGIVLGNALLKNGYNVIMSELHGLAQRGGIVTVEMKIGEYSSPIVGKNKADIIVGFEAAETYRILHKAKKDAVIIMNRYRIIPFTVGTGESKYANIESIVSEVRKNYKHLYDIEGSELAKKAGATITTNMVMLGALIGTETVPLMKEEIHNTIMEQFPEKYRDINTKAFELGYEEIQKRKI